MRKARPPVSVTEEGAQRRTVPAHVRDEKPPSVRNPTTSTQPPTPASRLGISGESIYDGLGRTAAQPTDKVSGCEQKTYARNDKESAESSQSVGSADGSLSLEDDGIADDGLPGRGKRKAARTRAAKRQA